MRAMTDLGGIRGLDRLFRQGTLPAGDRALLDHFLSRGDEAAFEALVMRHGPMVRGVCRRLLASPHDADDAFQATFLVLVQKAGRLRDADRLGPWLYGVATRVATRARSRAARRRDRPTSDADAFPGPDDGSADWLDVRPILDAEMGRLSAKHRDVLVLCVLEGLTAEEAAEQLACPIGTVKSRLARGREALRDRLIGRGIAPAIAAAVAAGSARSASACPVPESLLRTTIGTVLAAGASPASLAPGLVALTRGAAPSMLSKSSAMAALCCGGVVLSGLGLASWKKAEVRAQEPGPGAAAPAGDAGKARAETINHLKLLMLAFHNYMSANEHLPPAATPGPNGSQGLSWRVALLPYLNENVLYHQFHLDEPWDSPHNKLLIARMPAVFATPDAAAPAGQTRILGFSGPGAIFEDRNRVTFADVQDGVSNTAILGIARDPVPWTKPADLPFFPGRPLPALDDSDPKGHLLALLDGSVKTLPHGQDAVLRAAITRSGGEVIDWPRPEQAGPPPGAPAPSPTIFGVAPPDAVTPARGTGGMAAGMAPPATAIAEPLEARLQRLEDKLDRILQKLDATPAATPFRKAGGLGR